MAAPKRTTLDLFQEHFGERPSEKLAAAVTTRLDWRELRLFHERAVEETRGVAPPELGPGELRPYIPASSLQREVHGDLRGVAFSYTDFYEGQPLPQALDQMKHHLLYCHSIAIDDPLLWLTAAFGDEDFRASEAREMFGRYVEALAALAPLVEEGALVLVEPVPDDTGRWIEGRYGPEPLRYTHGSDHQRLRRAVTEALLPTADWSDYAAYGVEVDKYGEGFWRVQLESAFDAVTRALFEAGYWGELDLHLPTRHHRQVLDLLLNVQAAGPRKQAESRRLRDLLGISLPELATLGVEDLIAIRRDEAFAEWRVALEDALREADAKGVSTENADELRAELSERLAGKRRELRAAVGKASFRGRVKDSVKTLTVGSIIALGAAAVTSSVSALVSAGLAIPAHLAYAFAASRRTSEDTSLLAHYSLFSPPSADSG